MKKLSTRLCLLLLSAGLAAQTSSPPKPAAPPDDESKWFDLIVAAQGGGGFDSPHPVQSTAYAGLKFGIPVLGIYRPGHQLRNVTLDLGYDRLRGTNAF